MSQPDTMAVLLVTEHAEEIKLVTMSLRSFYPGCRVEAVYSVNEAFEWSSKLDWRLILLDEQLPHDSDVDLLQEIRRRAPRSAIIVQGAHDDPRIALQIMRNGADYYFFKHSHTSLLDLPLASRDVIEKRDLRSRLGYSEDRYRHLTDNLTEVVYELDAEGRFVYVSSAVTALLDYEPHELIGLPYSALLPTDELGKAERRVNERRAAPRATRKLPLRLRGKGEAQDAVSVEINANGLYDRHRKYVGTMGIIWPVIERRDETLLLRRLADLEPSLSTILTSAQQLLHTMQELRNEFGTESSSPPRNSPVSQMTDTEQTAGHPPPNTTSAVPCTFLERRHYHRFEVQVDTYMRHHAASWIGTALNVSLGGLYLVCKGPVSARVGQPIRLGFTSDVGILEFSGTVGEIREPVLPHSQREKASLTGLAIVFSPLEDAESRILQSLFEGLRGRSITVKLTGLLLPDDGGARDSSAVMDHAQAQHVNIPSGLPKTVGGASTDRRVSARVHLVVPVQVEFIGSPLPLDRTDAYLIDLTTTGARLRLRASRDLEGRHLLLRLAPSALASNQPANASRGTPYSIIGEVVWVASEPDSSTVDEPLSSVVPLLVGLRFVRFDGESEHMIAELITQYLTSADRLRQPNDDAMLVSELLECRNERGRRLSLYHDHLREPLSPGSPLAVLAPGFGETKKDYISLAYYFACNGFRVLRYDHTCHIGDSEGDILQTTLSGMNEDLGAILDYADRLWPASPILVAATGLTGRVALKALTRSRRVTLLVLLGGVVDVQSTLRTVHEEDLISSHLQGIRRGISNLLGFTVDADRWLADAARHEYADLQTTLRDAEQFKTPVVFFSSEHDTWVDQASLKKVKASLREYAIDWYLMSDALHNIHIRPDHARTLLYERMVGCCRAWFYAFSTNTQVVLPSEHEVDRQVRLERERARTQHQMAKAENFEFWRDYLDQSQFIVNFSDYWHLLDHIYRLMGPIGKDERILDAGCGNGNFGMFFFINESYRLRHSPMGHRVQYWGVDFVRSGLSQATRNLARMAADIRERFSSTEGPLPFLASALAQADLDHALPFRDHQFHRVLCNLVIGYVRDPLFTLRELMRILSPGGKLVVTILKPQADLSLIYRNFIGLGKSPEDIEQAKQVLNTSGRIAQREQEGVFRFFDQPQLATLLMSSGALQPRIYSTFANQAYVAVAEKACETKNTHGVVE
ncbi:MAG: PilZ domain-containing protein [Nitrospiraceae bacterium]